MKARRVLLPEQKYYTVKKIYSFSFPEEAPFIGRTGRRVPNPPEFQYAAGRIYLEFLREPKKYEAKQPTYSYFEPTQVEEASKEDYENSP